MEIMHTVLGAQEVLKAGHWCRELECRSSFPVVTGIAKSDNKNNNNRDCEVCFDN